MPSASPWIAVQQPRGDAMPCLPPNPDFTSPAPCPDCTSAAAAAALTEIRNFTAFAGADAYVCRMTNFRLLACEGPRADAHLAFDLKWNDLDTTTPRTDLSTPHIFLVAADPRVRFRPPEDHVQTAHARFFDPTTGAELDPTTRTPTNDACIRIQCKLGAGGLNELTRPGDGFTFRVGVVLPAGLAVVEVSAYWNYVVPVRGRACAVTASTPAPSP